MSTPCEASGMRPCPATPEEDEVQAALRLGESHFPLRADSLRAAAQHIFAGAQALSPGRYAALQRGNYEGFDLHRHGRRLLLPQLTMLAEAFEQAVQSVSFRPRQSTGNVLSLGCGPGRSAVALIELALKRRMRCVVFNDLLPSHVEQTREVVRQAYNTGRDRVGPVDLRYVAGDFLDPQTRFDDSFDAVIAEWFVTSEIVDFSSVEAIRSARSRLYRKVRDLLGCGGVFAEDVPFGDRVAQFYHLARLKTYAVLRDMGVLAGESHNLLLSNFAQTLTPQEAAKGVTACHLRYAPDPDAHFDELRKAGLRRTRSWVRHLPLALRDPDAHERALGSAAAVRDLFSRHQDVPDLIEALRQMERDLLVPAGAHPLTCGHEMLVCEKAAPSPGRPDPTTGGG